MDVQSLSSKELAATSKEFSSLASLQELIDQHENVAKALRDVNEMLREEEARYDLGQVPRLLFVWRWHA